ncbi:glycosyltransferase family 2 protein [Gracilibacillus phocaeensis]|uniref:glycosyltransferase family 2 protein n=1 Tax=Gracilibacillus phocaeensis TaxID=2042304 RepID=UPI001030C425|nr:glycosyltransferase family 2 protein [Gracilibacillus phocaeensis]
MWGEAKVSIIVPIYNVEPYIHRCLDSIIHQTYSNLEIILVDDGSPDDCGKIANDYQQTDRRVHVIHQENAGLSDARNQGVKRASGDYTMFVDSDDWLKETMVEMMMTYMISYQADVVQTAFYYAYQDKLLVDQRYFKEHDRPVLLQQDRLMYELIANEKVKNFAWGKLYKTSFIRNIPFKKGVLFEDVFWAHHVMHQVDRYLILHQPMYYYYQRDNSIAATYTTRSLDMLKGLKERHRFVESNYPELMDTSYKLILKTSLIHYNLCTLNRSIDSNKLHREAIAFYIRNNDMELKQAISGDKQLRLHLRLFLWHPYLYMGYLGWKKGLRQMKLLRTPTGLTEVTKEVLVK